MGMQTKVTQDTTMNNTMGLTATSASALSGVETLFGLIKGAPTLLEPPSKAMVEFQKFLDERHGVREEKPPLNPSR
jgi:hypothetical protein